MGPGPLRSNGERLDWARERMVETQLLPRGIKDPRVLAAMRKVPRHLFVEDSLRSRAYEDYPLPIGQGQTISQPFMVALMSEALQLSGIEAVLEIGTGSGYQAAVLAELAARVYTVERVPALAGRARNLLDSLGYRNVLVKLSDGTLGWTEFAPFDRIVVTAGSPSVPPSLLDQLTEGGKLVIPVGGEEVQELTRITRAKGGRLLTEKLGGCMFVKLIGREGWKGNGE